MTQLLGKWTKQSSEVLDYDVDFTKWFSNRADTPSSYEVVVDDAELTISSTVRSDKIVKVVLSGGLDGMVYKVTVRMTTSALLVKEADFTVRIKDV